MHTTRPANLIIFHLIAVIISEENFTFCVVPPLSSCKITSPLPKLPEVSVFCVPKIDNRTPCDCSLDIHLIISGSDKITSK